MAIPADFEPATHGVEIRYSPSLEAFLQRLTFRKLQSQFSRPQSIEAAPSFKRWLVTMGVSSPPRLMLFPRPVRVAYLFRRGFAASSPKDAQSTPRPLIGYLRALMLVLPVIGNPRTFGQSLQSRHSRLEGGRYWPAIPITGFGHIARPVNDKTFLAAASEVCFYIRNYPQKTFATLRNLHKKCALVSRKSCIRGSQP